MWIITCTHVQKIATHLEKNIKETIVTVIESNCNCNFISLMIDQGEFSCQTSSSGVTYRQVMLWSLVNTKNSLHSTNSCYYSHYNRARITGSSETLSAPEILAHMQDWLTNDGTFLYTYHARIRLRVDPHCPLKIKSFSEPECPFGDGKEDEKHGSRFTDFFPHGSSDEL